MRVRHEELAQDAADAASVLVRVVVAVVLVRVVTAVVAPVVVRVVVVSVVVVAIGVLVAAPVPVRVRDHAVLPASAARWCRGCSSMACSAWKIASATSRRACSSASR